MCRNRRARTKQRAFRSDRRAASAALLPVSCLSSSEASRFGVMNTEEASPMTALKQNAMDVDQCLDAGLRGQRRMLTRGPVQHPSGTSAAKSIAAVSTPCRADVAGNESERKPQECGGYVPDAHVEVFDLSCPRVTQRLRPTSRTPRGDERIGAVPVELEPFHAIRMTGESISSRLPFARRKGDDSFERC